MNCRSCGRTQSESATFCSACGARLRSGQHEGTRPTLSVEPDQSNGVGAAPGNSGMCIASLVLGVLSVLGLAVLTGIPAIVTGIVVLGRKRPGKGMAIAGLVTGSVGTVVTGGILLAFVIPLLVPAAVDRATQDARVTQTRQELQVLREAIAGDPVVATGFRDDIGRLPRHLVELATRNPFDVIYMQVQYVGKETLPGWNSYIRRGWNGPYIREDGNLSYTRDAWGVPYRYTVENTDTVGLESAGPDGLFFNQPGASTDDDIRIRF